MRSRKRNLAKEELSKRGEKGTEETGGQDNI
jgi:hypothetical protein